MVEFMQKILDNNHAEVAPPLQNKKNVGIYRYSVYITQRNLTKFEECSIPPQNLMEYH
jgi:hypothetical protein